MLVVMEIEIPDDLADFHLPRGVDQRLHELLDRQDGGQALTTAERSEAEGLVSLAEWLSLMKLKARISNSAPSRIHDCS